MTDLVARAIDVNAGQFLLGNEVFEAAGATFVRNRETWDIYDSNHVTHVMARTQEEIDRLFATVEREFGHSRHRRFDVDFRTPPEFVARLAFEGGFDRSSGLIMLLEGELLGKAPGEFDIRPVISDEDWAAYWALTLLDWKESHRNAKDPPGEDVARRMLEANRKKQPPVQNWMAYVDGQAVSFFNSWQGVDGMGQVENLFTHPDFRNRGIARALIHHCVHDSRANGAGPVVIVADPTDTPKNLYNAMGFRPVAVVSHYLKKLDQ